MASPTLKQTWDAELYEARHSFVWHFGESLVELLAPAAGERILDLGCGPGQLTNRIAEHGATAIGLDSSPDMIGQARQNYPKLRFVLQSAAAMEFEDEFDAVFSNATLHWILDAHTAAANMFRALRKGGRLVAEFGGIGNVRSIETVMNAVLARYAERPVPGRRYYPSVGQYAGVLEAAGFEVRFAHLFDRPTPLEGENGMLNWIVQFSGFQFDVLAPDDRKRALQETIDLLRPTQWRDEQWFADYRRLRIIAVKV